MAKPLPKTKKKTAAEAIEAALKVVEPDFEQNLSDREEMDADAPTGDRLSPVARPNGEDYRPRVVGHMTDVEIVLGARVSGAPVLLSGYPGCGKTALVEAAFGEELITAHAHGDMEVSDLIGSYTQEPDGSYTWVDGPLVEAMRSGRPLFVDDITLAPATVLARLYPAMDGRGEIRVVEHRSEIVRAEQGFFVCGAHNPGAPGAILSEALASRFILPIVVDSDLKMALDMGIDSRIVSGAAALQKMRAEGTISWAPEMRELIAFQRNRDAFGEKIAVNALIGSASPETRDTIASTLSTWFPGAETLRIQS